MGVLYVGKVGEQIDVATGSATTVVTSTVNVPVGQFLILAARAGQALIVSSVADSAGNTWTKLASSDPLQTTMSVWYCTVTSALTTSSTITTTFNGTTSGNRLVAVWAFNGITQPSTTNTTARVSALATSVTLASVTPQQYASLLFTAVGANLTTTYTVSTGWTALPVTTSSVYMGVAYTIRNSMASLATTWTIASSGALGAVAGTFTPDGGDFLALL